MRRHRPGRFGLTAAALVLLTAGAACGQGVALQGVGPVNRSMGGAAVAAPIDASGALYQNPAAIAGLRRSELSAGLELILPRAQVRSSVDPGAFGPLGPSVRLSGETKSDSGTFAVPSIGLVYQPEGARWTAGLGLFAVGGFGANFPGDPANPILTQPPPAGVGGGPVYTDFQVLQIVPTAAVWLTDRTAVGFSPVVNLANLSAVPAILSPPDDANGDGFPTFPAVLRRRSIYGGGFHLGVYHTRDTWAVGASFKSKQWFESFFFNSSDELGRPVRLRQRLEYPMIASVGAAYTGFERWVLAADVRYLNYADAAGFARSGFGPDGRLQGLGWDDIVAVAVGAQYKLTDAAAVRLGYVYQSNPIPSEQAVFNVGSSLTSEHSVYIGAGYRLTDALSLDLCYGHLFPNSVTGRFRTPQGPVPGTAVSIRSGADFLVFGATVRF